MRGVPSKSFIGLGPEHSQASALHKEGKNGCGEGEWQWYFSLPLKERKIVDKKDCHLILDAVLVLVDLTIWHVKFFLNYI